MVSEFHMLKHLFSGGVLIIAIGSLLAQAWSIRFSRSSRQRIECSSDLAPTSYSNEFSVGIVIVFAVYGRYWLLYKSVIFRVLVCFTPSTGNIVLRNGEGLRYRVRKTLRYRC